MSSKRVIRCEILTQIRVVGRISVLLYPLLAARSYSWVESHSGTWALPCEEEKAVVLTLHLATFVDRMEVARAMVLFRADMPKYSTPTMRNTTRAKKTTRSTFSI